MPSPSTLNDGQEAAPPDPEPGKRRVDHSVDSRQRAFAITAHPVLLIRAPKLRYINFGAHRVIHTPVDARLRRSREVSVAPHCFTVASAQPA